MKVYMYELVYTNLKWLRRRLFAKTASSKVASLCCVCCL